MSVAFLLGYGAGFATGTVVALTVGRFRRARADVLPEERDALPPGEILDPAITLPVGTRIVVRRAQPGLPAGVYRLGRAPRRQD